jgi:glycosyltransferase involved in cell wall biosynthesis
LPEAPGRPASAERSSAAGTVGHLFFEFLPPTQTFIRSLLAAHERYEARILTRTLLDPAGFPRERIAELGSRDPGQLTRIGRGVLRRLDRWEGPFDRELVAAAGDCDVLHAHFGPTGSRAALAAQRLGVPLITSFYGWDLALPEGGEPSAEYRRLFRRGAAFVCEGPAMAEHLASVGCPRERIDVVPIAIEPDLFPFRPREPSQALKLLHTGRLIPKKGTDVAIRAFAAAEGPRRGWQLWIVGDGPERQRLEDLAESLGAAGSVRFFGNLPYDRYRELIAEAQIGVQPSRTAPDGDTEGGAPTVLLEMQASGMAVAGTRHADIPFVVADEEVLVDEEDSEGLAEVLVRIAERGSAEWLSAAERARAEVLDRHAADRVAAQVEQLYDRVRERAESEPAAPPGDPAAQLRWVAERSRAKARHIGGKARHAAAERIAKVNEEPIFVLGQVKSGTTAIAAMLAERTGSTVTLDVPALFGPKFLPVATGEVSLRELAAANRVDFSRDIIKQASLTWIYPQARAAFPEARFVMIVRDPRENVRSILNRLDLPGDRTELTPEQMESVPGPWRWFLQVPRELGVEADSYTDLLAAGWKAAAEVYLAHPEQMHLVKYEDFLRDKVGCVSGCASDLGLPIVNDISHLLDVQYQPRGEHDVDWEEFFGERNLAAIERACAGPMAELGYGPSVPAAGGG